jgi:hypothetical protein
VRAAIREGYLSEYLEDTINSVEEEIVTVYGGTVTDYGMREDGFFVVCCKCGWHSEVHVVGTYDAQVEFDCLKCGNEHVEV